MMEEARTSPEHPEAAPEAGPPRFRPIRFARFQRELNVKQRRVSYSDVVAAIAPGTRKKVRLRGIDIFRLLRPYVQVRFSDQIKAVLPLAIYLNLFQILILRQYIQEPWIVMLGLFAVI
ncbi:MAG: DUF1538 domain-containing protein, partial [Gammaproteobacteria bacterium]